MRDAEVQKVILNVSEFILENISLEKRLSSYMFCDLVLKKNGMDKEKKSLLSPQNYKKKARTVCWIC